jgi:hypothetical protein
MCAKEKKRKDGGWAAVNAGQCRKKMMRKLRKGEKKG